MARLTVAAEIAATRPELAQKLAPRAPGSLSSAAMQKVAEAAVQGTDPVAETFTLLKQLSAVAPLAPEPYLVQAALAERKQDYARAEQLLQQAEIRDPRSIAARYLLADVALRNGEVVKSLRQLAVLSRLLPGAAVQLIPSLSAYARTPGAARELAAVLNDNEQLKRPLLTALSSDPENVTLVLQLAGSDVTLTDVESQGWKTRLLEGLIDRGEFEKSYSLWRRFVPGAGARPLLFNGEFKKLSAPPPFNWNFSSSNAGVSEPDKGQLRVVYYGRDPTSLASQLLMLPPGKYRFETPISGEVGDGSLQWTVVCLGGGGKLAEQAISEPGTLRFDFAVPSASCDAQWLELKGTGQGEQEPADVNIGPAHMERVGA